jgi:tetratricopeptide (TPR) repeat protein
MPAIPAETDIACILELVITSNRGDECSRCSAVRQGNDKRIYANSRRFHDTDGRVRGATRINYCFDECFGCQPLAKLVHQLAILGFLADNSDVTRNHPDLIAEHAMSQAATELTLQAVGMLTITAADGSDRTPKGRKARGMLALLAVAPDNRRSRPWLQDKLWSDRSPKQGAASLRQTLSEVRRAFGDAKGCLKATRDIVALDKLRVNVQLQPRELLPGADNPVLFENLDIADPEFEDWLRDQRSQFEASQQLHHETAKATEALIRPIDRQQKPEPKLGDHRPLQLVISRSLSDPLVPSQSRERIIAESLTDIIARTVSEVNQVDVIDLRRCDGASRTGSEGLQRRNTLAITADIAEDSSGLTCRFALTSPTTNQLLWTSAFQASKGTLDVNDPAILRDLNQIVEQIYFHFLANATGTEAQQVASLLCCQGIKLMLRLRHDDLLLADQLFQQAYELEPRGIYLAWRAYLRTYLLVEFMPTNRQVIAEEAVAFMHRALELEPSNSYVASFSAQVHSIVRQSYVAAFELAERSVQLNPANPMGWACLGIAQANLGKAQAGFQHTLKARELAGATPFRFFVNALSCIAGSMAGEIDKAILLGEASHGLAPTFKPPMRFLSALYLLRDRHEDSQAMVDTLKVSEPGFSYDLLRDKSYPVSSLHRSKLLENLPQRQI